jgi:hypothetical protein
MQHTVRSGPTGQVLESMNSLPCLSAPLCMAVFRGRDSSWTRRQLGWNQHQRNSHWDLLPTKSPSTAQPWVPLALYLPFRINCRSGRIQLARHPCYRVLGPRMGIRRKDGGLRFSKSDGGVHVCGSGGGGRGRAYGGRWPQSLNVNPCAVLYSSVFRRRFNVPVFHIPRLSISFMTWYVALAFRKRYYPVIVTSPAPISVQTSPQ